MKDDKGELYFDVEARHLRQLGRELVSARTTALAELVKNAYDADAHRVTVRFLDPKKGGVLEIEDDGDGMTLDDIRRRWMRLSTSHKEKEPHSPRYGRARAGQKGIGRFAAESLGSRLVLSSTAADSASQVVATFDWELYNTTRSLSEIPATYVTKSATASRGTVLRIEGLHDNWPVRDQKKVKRALRLLQPPFPTAEVYDAANECGVSDPGFAVHFQVGDEEVDVQGQDGEWNDDFLSAATAIVHATVDQQGRGRWRVHSDVLDFDATHEHQTPLLTVGALELKAWYFIFKPNALGSIGKKLAKDMGKEYGGIRVYRDGMRVPPYGDPDNDWVKLDESTRKRHQLFPHANNNWFGHVSLSREHNVLLIDTASREGVVENDAFSELRTFVYDALCDCARRIAVVRGKKVTATRRPTPKLREDLASRMMTVVQQLASKFAPGDDGERMPDVTALIDEARATVADAKADDTVAKKVETVLMGELELLRVLASLGISVAVFGHEVRAALNGAGGGLTAIDEDLADAPSPWDEIASNSVDRARRSLARVNTLAHFIEGYTSRARLRERGPCALHEALRRFSESFEPLAQRHSASFEWHVEPAHLRGRDLTATEIDAILINLLTNSLKAFQSSTKPERRILAGVEEDGGELILRFQDTGCGIPDAVRDELFDPFVTTTLASDSGLGTGTGLGLKIVHDIAESRGGSTRVTIPDNGFSTCIEVRLPAWNGAEHE